MQDSEIVARLGEIADLLEQQNANPFRVNAYRRAAGTIEHLPRPIADIIAQKGFAGLIELPGIGQGIARSIFEYVTTGHMSRLDSLRAGHDPIAMFEKIPGVGATLAHRVVENLHIDTLEALEVAAHTGRLAKVPGFSGDKVHTIKVWLAKVLGSHRPMRKNSTFDAEPTVDLLLQIDREYRDRAHAGELPKIAPRRFNPSGEKWLPIMHSTKGEWHFTALYSNTARAHRLNRTDDWVVVYFYDKEHHEGQHTIVTETKDSLLGKRVVRGREIECLDHYFHKVG